MWMPQNLESVCLSKYRELLDYFGKKIAEALPSFYLGNKTTDDFIAEIWTLPLFSIVTWKNCRKFQL